MDGPVAYNMVAIHRQVTCNAWCLITYNKQLFSFCTTYKKLTRRERGPQEVKENNII